MHKNYHCEFSNTMPFIVSSHSFPFLFSEIFCPVTLYRNFRAESLTWKENFQVFRLQRKTITQTFNTRYLNGICFFFQTYGKKQQQQKSFYYMESCQMKTNVQLFRDGWRGILVTSFRIHAWLSQSSRNERCQILNCNSLVLRKLWDTSFEDSNVAQTQIQQLTIYRNFPNIVLQYHYFINIFSTCTRRQAALKYKYWRWNTYAVRAAWKAHLAFYIENIFGFKGCFQM